MKILTKNTYPAINHKISFKGYDRSKMSDDAIMSDVRNRLETAFYSPSRQILDKKSDPFVKHSDKYDKGTRFLLLIKDKFVEFVLFKTKNNYELQKIASKDSLGQPKQINILELGQAKGLFLTMSKNAQGLWDKSNFINMQNPELVNKFRNFLEAILKTK